MTVRSYRLFNIFALLFFASLVLVLVSKNLFVDPYGVLGTSSLPLGSLSNERFLKVEHLCTEKPSTYEGIVLASSRSGMTDPSLFASTPSVRYYNLSVFSGKPTDMLLLYHAFSECQGPPPEVVIGLDAMAFMAEKRSSDLSQRHHPRVSGQSPLAFWRDYLLAASALISVEKFMERADPRIQFDLMSGTYTLRHYDRLIAEDHRAYLRRFETLRGPPISVAIDHAQIAALQDLLRTIEADHGSAVVFLQPMHRFWRGRLSEFLTGLKPILSQAIDPLDLSRLGAEDDRLWYEEKHYRHALAERVASTVRTARVPQRPIASVSSQ